MKILNILSNVIISVLLSGPFLVLGGLLIIDSGELSVLPLAVLLVGLAILGVGLYVNCSAVAPEPPLSQLPARPSGHLQSQPEVQSSLGGSP